MECGEWDLGVGVSCSSSSSSSDCVAQSLCAPLRAETRESVVTTDGVASGASKKELRVAFAVEVVLTSLCTSESLPSKCGSLVTLVDRGVELPEDEGGCKTWNGLWKISLADSEGVMVALVMMDLVSSSS